MVFTDHNQILITPMLTLPPLLTRLSRVESCVCSRVRRERGRNGERTNGQPWSETPKQYENRVSYEKAPPAKAKGG